MLSFQNSFMEIDDDVHGKGKGKHVVSNGDGDSLGNLPWVEKYRPKGLEDVVHHSDIISTLRRFIGEGRLPHLLLYGPPGTGKTSTAVALAHDIFGREGISGQVLELNASDERGINVVREQIKVFAATKTLAQKTNAPFKLIILDECDAMTSAAQNALRRVMERHVRNVRFILICNYVGQIIPALQSRCTRFRFGPLPKDALSSRIDLVCRQESLKITSEAKDAIIKLSQGDMRRILNVLQASAATKDTIDEDIIYSVTATPHPSDLDYLYSTLTTQQDMKSIMNVLRKLQIEKGLGLSDILRAMFDRMQLSKSITTHQRLYLLKQLADIEYRLAQGSTEQLQAMAMVGAFVSSHSLKA